MTDARDYRPSCRTAPYPSPGAGEDACVACGEIHVQGRLREHLEKNCGGAAWMKRKLLEKLGE
jgi:hypothetical protein